MRKKYFAPLSFLLAIILFFNAFTPVQAANTKLLWDLSFDGRLMDDFTVNDQGEARLVSWLPEQTEFAGWRVYAFDLMTVSEKGDVLQKIHKQATDLAVYTINNINYTALANSKTGMVELYDDNFQLVASRSLPIKNGPIFVNLINDVLSIGYVDMSSVGSGHFILNPTNLEPITSDESPNRSYMALKDGQTGNLVIDEHMSAFTFGNGLLVDTSKVEIPNGSLSDLSYLGNVLKVESYYYVLAEYRDYFSGDSGFAVLLKINENGQIVDQSYYAKGEYTGYFSIDYFDGEIIVTDSNTIRLKYDIETLQLTEEKTLTEGNAEYGVLTDNLYYIEENHRNVVKNQYDEVLYTLPTAYEYTAINEYYILLYHSYAEDIAFTLHDIKTGERVEIDYLDTLIVSDEYVLAADYHWIWENDGYTQARLYDNLSVDKPVQPEQPEGPSYDTNKQWKITFSKDVDPASVTSDSIYVVDKKGVKVDGLTYKVSGDQVFVSAPENGYETGKNYTLYVTKQVVSTESKVLKAAEMKKFFIK